MVTLPVTWNGYSRDIDFLVVPDLEQEFYFGIEFWKAFDLPVVGETRSYVSELIKEDDMDIGLRTIKWNNSKR